MKHAPSPNPAAAGSAAESSPRRKAAGQASAPIARSYSVGDSRQRCLSPEEDAAHQLLGEMTVENLKAMMSRL